MSVLFYSLIIFLSLFSDHSKDYKRIHREAIVVDTHNDVLMRVMTGDNIEQHSTKGHSDLVRFKEGGYDGQVFSVWVDPKWIAKDSAFIYANKMIDSLDAICRRNQSRLIKVTNGSQFDAVVRNNKLAAMIGIEGGHSIENSIDKLIHFYKRGARYLGVTWNNSVDWATSGRDETMKNPNQKGLTDFGNQVIRVMDSLGMLIDVSHCGEQTFYDILKVTRHPIIASHSAVYKLCRHFRNLKDEQIKAIAKTGGVIMINFYSAFIDSTFNSKKEEILKKYQKKLAEVEKSFGNNHESYNTARDKFLDQKSVRIVPSVRRVADHIDYIKKLVGADYIGLGADYDGINIAPLGLEDVSKLPNLTRELLKRGYTVDEVKKILGGNFVRVFKQVCVK